MTFKKTKKKLEVKFIEYFKSSNNYLFNLFKIIINKWIFY